MHDKVLSLYPPGQQMCSWKVELFPSGKGAAVQFLRFLFWLGEAGDLLVFPFLGAELLQQCPHMHSPIDGHVHNWRQLQTSIQYI